MASCELSKYRGMLHKSLGPTSRFCIVFAFFCFHLVFGGVRSCKVQRFFFSFGFVFTFFCSLVAPPPWLACYYFYLVLVTFSFSNISPLFGFASWSFSTLLLNVPLHVFPPLLPCGGLACNNCL